MRQFLSRLKVRFLGLKRWQQALVVIAVLLFLFAPVRGQVKRDDGVGVAPISSPVATPSSTATPIVTPTPTATASTSTESRCVVVSQKKLKNIATGLTVSGDGTLTNGFAVKSNDYAEVWFIAAVIDGPGMGKGVVGIWASNRLEANDGLIFAIDANAGTFTDWGLGSTTDANITQNDHGAQEAATCAGQP